MPSFETHHRLIAALTATGAIVMATLVLITMIATIASAQLTPLALAQLMIGLAAAALTGGALLSRLAPWRGGEALLMGLFVLNVGLSGVYVFREQLPPHAWLATVALAALVFWRFLGLPETVRRPVVGTLRAIAAAAAVLPLLLAPVVLPLALGERQAPIFTPLDPETLRPRPSAPPLVLLVTFDALRARSLERLARLPHFAALAAESTWYTECRAASDRTLASMPALLSGAPASALLPAVRNRSGLLPAGAVPSVARHMRLAGYRTRYATALVSPEVFGMAGDFDGGLATQEAFRHYFGRGLAAGAIAIAADAPAVLQLAPRASAPEAARAVLEAAARELRQASDRTFLWVHLSVPHGPYYAFDPETPVALEGWGDRPQIPDAALEQATTARAAEIEAVYEKYVEVADALLGRLVHEAKAAGRWDEAMVIVTGDHGEAFEPGRAPHSASRLPEDVTRVPLFVRTPGQARPARSSALCGHEDLAPTILEAVFEPFESAFRGRPLGTSAAPRTVTASATFDRLFLGAEVGQLAAYSDRFKYVYHYRDGAQRLYDRVLDPACTRDVIDRHPKAAEALRREVWEEIARVPAPLPRPIFPPLPPERRLEAGAPEHAAHFGPGWSWAEPWGRWTDGPEARIRFAIEGETPPTRLILRGTGFREPAAPHQIIAVRVNGQELGRRPLAARPGEEPEALSFDLGDRLRPGGNVLVIRVLSPRSPLSLGMSEDPRELGFGLVDLALGS